MAFPDIIGMTADELRKVRREILVKRTMPIGTHLRGVAAMTALIGIADVGEIARWVGFASAVLRPHGTALPFSPPAQGAP